MRVTLRMQAASPALRGSDTTLFTQPGAFGQAATALVPDYRRAVRSDAAQPESDSVRPHMSRDFARGSRNEDGTALIIALMSMMLLTALGAAVVMVSNTETMIANNHRNSQEALYAADAAVERVVQDLLMVPRWNDMLAGSVQSSFIDGAMTARKTLPGGGTLMLCCGTNTATAQLQADTDTLNLWGANNPQWQLFAWGPLSRTAPQRTHRQPVRTSPSGSPTIRPMRPTRRATRAASGQQRARRHATAR